MTNTLSVEDICNMALDMAGVRATVDNFNNEVSPQAEVCRRWYSPTANLIAEAGYWPSLEGTSALALLRERDPDLTWTSADPPPKWKYTYSVPTNLVRPRYLTSYAPFEFSRHSSGSGGRAIFTNQEDAILTYTKQDVPLSQWEFALINAVSAALAARICVPLSGAREWALNLAQMAEKILEDSRTQVAGMGDDMQLEPVPDWLVARGYSQIPMSQAFFYPLPALTILPNASGVNV